MMGSPKLRFKEFIGNWESIKLLDFSEIITSGSRDWAKYYANDGDKFIRMTNLVRDGIRLNLEDLKFVKLPESSTEGTRSSLQYGDILISITAELGKLGWIPKNFGSAYINQHTALVRLNNQINSKFVAYLLSTTEYNNKLNGLNDAGAKAGLNLSTIRQFKIKIPSKVEQTKIANFLTTVDEKISQLNEQHQLMIQYKKGVMQKIFNQEIRFKDDNGEDFGEWEERILEDVSIIIMGSSPKSENYNELGIGLPLLQGNADIKNRKSCPRNFTTEITKECDVGDILMSVRAPVGYVAKAMHDACIGRGIAAIRVKENNNQEFLYQYLIYMEDIWGRFSQGSTFDSVNSEQIKKLSLFIPCLQEQTKIADFLTKLDDKIEKLALQLEQVKTWKKGLLQQMFV